LQYSIRLDILNVDKDMGKTYYNIKYKIFARDNIATMFFPDNYINNCITITIAIISAPEAMISIRSYGAESRYRDVLLIIKIIIN